MFNQHMKKYLPWLPKKFLKNYEFIYPSYDSKNGRYIILIREKPTPPQETFKQQKYYSIDGLSVLNGRDRARSIEIRKDMVGFFVGADRIDEYESGVYLYKMEDAPNPYYKRQYEEYKKQLQKYKDELVIFKEIKEIERGLENKFLEEEKAAIEKQIAALQKKLNSKNGIK